MFDQAIAREVVTWGTQTMGLDPAPEWKKLKGRKADLVTEVSDTTLADIPVHLLTFYP
jgi:hypothetical protein